MQANTTARRIARQTAAYDRGVAAYHAGQAHPSCPAEYLAPRAPAGLAPAYVRGWEAAAMGWR